MKDKDVIDGAPLRGMRDFLPKSWIFRKKLLSVWAEQAEKFGFARYETPIVEPLSLLERKSGEEISEQIYNFEDKSGRQIALRPELTPSMVRIVSSNKSAFPAQGKAYSIGQCFRYERASLGRKREHFQWNIDIAGENSVACEALLIKCSVEVMKSLGFTAEEYKVRVNNRILVSDFLEAILVQKSDFFAVMGVMDKKEKISAEAFDAMLSELKLSSEQIRDINTFMNVKGIEELKKLGLSSGEGFQSLAKFVEYCTALGISENIVIDPSIVRGLAYYTGIVFEAFDTKGKYRAIFGGGRYDNLFEKLTGKPCSAVGLGFGDVVIEELYNEKFPITKDYQGIDVLLGGYSEIVISDLLKQANLLYSAGYSVDCDFKPRNLKKFITSTDKRNALIAAYIGENELQSRQILLKNLATSEQTTANLDDDSQDITIKLMKLLGNSNY